MEIVRYLQVTTPIKHKNRYFISLLDVHYQYIKKKLLFNYLYSHFPLFR